MPKIINLNIEETSGVDHPAHGDEGFIIMKSSTQEITEQLDNAETITKQVADLTAERDELVERVEKAETALAEAVAQIAALQDVTEPTVEELAKSAPEPVQKALDDMRVRLEKAEQDLAAERDAKALADAEAFVKSLDRLSLDVAEVAPLLKDARAVVPDLVAKLEKSLTAVNGQVETAGIFKELGTGRQDDVSIETLAKSRYEAGEFPTFEQAVAAVAQQRPDLYEAGV